MKTILIGIFLLTLAAIISIYVFIPRRIVIGHEVTADTNDRWAFHYLLHETEWKKWWPSVDTIHDAGPDTACHYNDMWFQIDSLYYNALTVRIGLKKDTVNSRMVIIPLVDGNTRVAWQCTLDGAYNPLKRWNHFWEAVAVKENMKSILDSYRNWLSVTKNIYGFEINHGKIIDSMLITQRVYFPAYPDAKQVDSVFRVLSAYVEDQGGTIVGRPMLNIIEDSANLFNTQFALPVSNPLEESGNISNKKMFRGNALVMKVDGGPYTIQKAYEAAEQYKIDHQMVSPAVPFQSIITDRLAEPDTSKWETIIYYPVK